jgi:hypothetical protein
MTVVGESDGGIIVGSIMKGYIIENPFSVKSFFLSLEVRLMPMVVFNQVI